MASVSSLLTHSAPKFCLFQVYDLHMPTRVLAISSLRQVCDKFTIFTVIRESQNRSYLGVPYTSQFFDGNIWMGTCTSITIIRTRRTFKWVDPWTKGVTHIWDCMFRLKRVLFRQGVIQTQFKERTKTSSNLLLHTTFHWATFYHACKLNIASSIRPDIHHYCCLQIAR